MLFAGALVTAALLLVSCGPPAEPAPPATPPALEKPKYGGSINVLVSSSTVLEVWDSAAIPRGMGAASSLVYEYLVSPDWSKGLAGSGQVDWGAGVMLYEGFGPELAESWDIPEVGTWVLKIRRGTRFALAPSNKSSQLVKGRELTADDVVWNIRRYHSDPAFANAMVRLSHPAMAAAVTAEKTGPWEVTLKTPTDPWTAFFWILFGGSSQHMFAPEVIAAYGNGGDWRNAVGTGPFTVTNLVSGSAATFARNPGYWGKNPVGPGKNSPLPYVDKVKILVVPDLSTRLALVRTSRVDWASDMEWEDAMSLFQVNPRLKYKNYLSSGLGIHLRTENEDSPLNDKRVRQAIMRATDFDSIKRDLYQGRAEIQVWPVAPSVSWLFVPLNNLPESVRRLYKYDPPGARELLAEAGYPEGFKTRMIVRSHSNEMDLAETLKAMWERVGIDLEIRPLEKGVVNSIHAGTQDEAMLRVLPSDGLVQVFDLARVRGVVRGVNDPVVLKAYQDMQQYVFVDMPKVAEIYRSMVPYLMEQAYVIPRPTPYSYTIWQPWVKNHNGEAALALWLKHAWIDQDLKARITRRK